MPNLETRAIRERALLAIALLVGGVLWYTCRHFTVDDAFIAYRHARHIARGAGPVMNPGERVEGVSNLPWTVTLAAAARSGCEPHAAGPWLSTLCGFGCVLLCFAAGKRHAGAGAAALLGASGVPLIAWSASGMETAAAALALLAVAYGIESIRAGDAGARPWATGASLGLLASLRPEGAVFGLASTAAVRRAGPPVVRRVLVAAGLVLGTLVVFRIFYYGDWLPNPARAKSPDAVAILGPGILYVFRFAIAYPLVLVLALRAGGSVPALVATQLAVCVLVGGDRFPGYRFAAVVWPLLAVGAAATLVRTHASKTARRGSLAVAALLAAGGAALALVPQLATPLAESIATLERLQRPVSTHATLLQAEIRHFGIVGIAVAVWIATARWRNAHPGLAVALLVAATLVPSAFDPALRGCRAPDPAARYGRPVGEWLRAAAAPGTVVATNAAGALPYWSELPVVDMLGLTDRHIARRPAESRAWIGHERGDGAYVLARRPDIVIFGGPEGSVEPWPFPGDRDLARDPTFGAEYVLERVPLAGFEFVFYRRRDVTLRHP